MRTVHSVLAASAGLVAATLFGPAISAHATAAVAADVITVDSSHALWRSSVGAGPTQLRAGAPDTYLDLSGDDGSTAIWDLGNTLPQTVIVHNGSIIRAFNHYQLGRSAMDVASGAPVAVVAVPGLSGQTQITVVDATTAGTLGTFSTVQNVQDLFLSQNGTTLYLLAGGAPFTYYRCPVTATMTCSPLVSLAAVPAASATGAIALWDHISADGSTIAGVIDTGVASSPGHPQFDGYTVTGLPSAPHVLDSGPGLTSGVGRFIGNDLFVAVPGALLSFPAPVNFQATAATSTPMTMTGAPSSVLPASSAFNATFTSPTPFATSAKVLRLVANTFSYPTSGTFLISSALRLFPGATAAGWPYWYWHPAGSQLQYSYDKVAWVNFTAWPTASFGVRRTVWLRSWHNQEINAAASSSTPILITAKPVVSAVYHASTRRMYGLATVPDGIKILIQRRISTNTWATVLTPAVTKWNYSVTLPAIAAQWRAVVLPSSQYIEALSATVIS